MRGILGVRDFRDGSFAGWRTIGKLVLAAAARQLLIQYLRFNRSETVAGRVRSVVSAASGSHRCGSDGPA